MSDLDDYKPSGWRRDLVHILGCYYATQVGSVAKGSQPWEANCQKFLEVMEQRKTSQWLDIKELQPLDFMGYVASVFMETTGHYLSGLSSYTGWIRPMSYYHWKVAELGQMDRCDKVKGLRPPRGPIARPSIKLQREARMAKAKAKEAKDTQRPGDDGATMGAEVDDPPAEDPMDVDREPQAEAGGGDNRTWYDLTVDQENEWLKEEVRRLRKALDKCPSSGPAAKPSRPAKPKDIKAVYSDISKFELPRDNIASPAVQASYPSLDYGQVRTLANHVLAMIADYHTTCVVSGSNMAHPIPSPEIEGRLPRWGLYQPPAGSGQTDVRIADRRARTLRVAVWLHRLDMALNSTSDASRSLIPDRHSRGPLLTYLLAPGTCPLTFEQVVARVIQDNQDSLNRSRQTLQTTLAGTNLRRTGYVDELASLSTRLDSTGDRRTRAELEARISLIRASITRLEESIGRNENRLEVIRLMEAEAQSHQAEEERPDSQTSDDAQVESSEEEAEQGHPQVDREEVMDTTLESGEAVSGQPSTSGEGAAATFAASVSTVTSEEERLLLDSTAPGDSPRSHTSSVAGRLASLHVSTPPHESAEQEGTSQ